LQDNPGNGTLSGNKTRNAANGIATFDDLSINKSANGYTLRVTSNGFSQLVSIPFDITRPILVVTNINDGGPGSLRQAIIDANDLTGADTIQFNIPGTGPFTIALTSRLPKIISPVVIDATTQPGFAGTPVIELNGASAGTGSSGLTIGVSGSTVKGLVINQFSDSGIQIEGDNNVIQGSYIGTNVTGSSANGRGNSSGIGIHGSGNLVGGLTPSQRNVISGNGGGISIFPPPFGVGGNIVQGNFIGTNAAGTAAIPNASFGIQLLSSSNTIGGAVAGAGNVISGNLGTGIRIAGFGDFRSDANVVQGNFIGVRADGVTPLPNTSATGGVSGILFLTSQLGSTSGNLIGGAAAGAGNIIAFNSGAGINFDARVDASRQNRITGNSICSNGALGIDLRAGIFPANEGQNAPVLIRAVSSAGTTIIQGTLNSTSSSNFTLEFFSNPSCDPSGRGEGQTSLGSAPVSTDSSGITGFKAALPGIPIGQVITATATDSNSNTSEFSQCVPVASLVSISGTVIGGSGVLVQLSGDRTQQTQTNGSGQYRFSDLSSGGNYAVTPVLSNFVFTPINRSYTNLLADQTNQDFTGIRSSFRISGTVRSSSTVNGVTTLSPLAGVSVRFAGVAGGIPTSGATTTDNNGNYFFDNLRAGNYTVTPTKQGFVLTPASANIAITTNDAVADFTAQTFITSLTGRMIFEVSGLIAGMNADGSGLVTLLASDVRSSNRRPALSPDGKKIAFHRPIDANTSQICVVNYDGSNLVCLTSNNFDSDPAWSPDGRRIAFVRRNTIPPTNLNQLFTMNADGTNQTGLQRFEVHNPTWSPDGTKIAYSFGESVLNLTATKIVVVNADGSNQIVLADNDDNTNPDWSPDGSKIIFLHRVVLSSTSDEVLTMNASNGSRKTRVASGRIGGRVAWSPDGSGFVYSRCNTGLIPSCEVVAASSDGRTEVVLATPDVFVDLDWGIEPVASAPAGSNIAVQLGGTSLTFSGVTSGGTTTVTPIPPNSAGTAPGGFALGNLAFEIQTTATVTPPITVCFTVPDTSAPTQTAFEALVILHNENGVFVDRTVSRNFATRQICASVNSLSPFALAHRVIDTLPSITGLVVDTSGKPISGVRVGLTGTERRSAETDSQGLFAFVNLTRNGNYNVQPERLGFLFTEVSQDFINATGEETVVFTGRAVRFTIGGKIADANGAGIAGVSVTLEGAPSVTTDASGS
jgi:hypothetical protein